MKLEEFHYLLIFLLFSSLLSFDGLSQAVENRFSGAICAQPDNSTKEGDFRVNLKTLLDSLSENGPFANGFYTTTAGQKDDDMLYGLIHCRGDLSTNDCALCTNNSTIVALEECPGTNQVSIWLSWCFLRYSNETFFGTMYKTAAAIINATDYDDPSAVQKGLAFMTELASTAPYQPLMFQTSVMDVGKEGKRYGLAQCTRDIIREDCRECLAAQLTTFRTTIGNKRNWEIYGLSCSMWYHDYQFYFNYSVLNEGAKMTVPGGGFVTIMFVAAVTIFTLLYPSRH